MRALSVLVSCLLCPSLVAGCARGERSSGRDPDMVARGSYLVTLVCSHDRHTPKIFIPAVPVLDSTRLLAGHPADWKVPPIPSGVLGPQGWGALAAPDLTAWAGPWGVSFTANLTPDATGLGS